MAPTARQDDITKAYRALVSRYHPDKHQGNDLEDLAEEKMAEINEAHAVLSDPARRAAYDAERLGGGAYAPPDVRPRPDAQQGLVSLVRLLLLGAGAFFAFRFVRNPRLLIGVAGLLLVVWLGPRLWRYMRGR